MKPHAYAPRYTPECAAAFCAALALACNVGKACEAIQISRVTAYEWREKFPDFAEAWDRALKVGVSALEDEAHRRAFEGVDKPIYQRGEMVGTVREYSDNLAMFLLSAHDRAKYARNSNIDLNASVSFKGVSDDELRNELAALVPTLGPAASELLDEVLGDEPGHQPSE